LLIITDFVEELLTVTLPKFTAVGLRKRTAEDGADATVVNPIEVGEFEALLTMLRLPEFVPALWGSTLTFSVALAPDARLNGRAGPATLKLAPVTLTWVIVRLPVVVMLTAFVEVVPTIVLPKSRAVGLTVSCVLLPLDGLEGIMLVVPHPEIITAAVATMKINSLRPTYKWPMSPPSLLDLLTSAANGRSSRGYNGNYELNARWKLSGLADYGGRTRTEAQYMVGRVLTAPCHEC
jgi:hypothetical protein